MTRVVIVYHSVAGHTAAVARSVLKGAQRVDGIEALLINADDLKNPTDRTLGPEWEALHDADAIIFGCPTYMGTVTSGFKRFMDASGSVWFQQRWRDKLAAGFTNAGGLSGDKLNTLMTLSVFAAQHSMIWVSQGIMSESSINRMSSYLGLMTQADDAPTDTTPPREDHDTAELFGERVARAALRWAQGPPA
jgi:multimeric flavodoxin WrbA